MVTDEILNQEKRWRKTEELMRATLTRRMKVLEEAKEVHQLEVKVYTLTSGLIDIAYCLSIVHWWGSVIEITRAACRHMTHDLSQTVACQMQKLRSWKYRLHIFQTTYFSKWIITFNPCPAGEQSSRLVWKTSLWRYRQSSRSPNAYQSG